MFYFLNGQFEVRIMRILTAMNIFKEAGKDEYVAGPLAGLFMDGSPLQDAVTHLYVNHPVS